MTAKSLRMPAVTNEQLEASKHLPGAFVDLAQKVFILRRMKTFSFGGVSVSAGVHRCLSELN
jgi:hypothetical protein